MSIPHITDDNRSLVGRQDSSVIPVAAARDPGSGVEVQLIRHNAIIADFGAVDTGVCTVYGNYQECKDGQSHKSSGSGCRTRPRCG